MNAGGLDLGAGLGSGPAGMMVFLAVLSLLPFVLMMTTSFLKFAVVLSILRNAMGTQQIPPTPVILGLAVILTVYVMAPVGSEVLAGLEEPPAELPRQADVPAGAAAGVPAGEAAAASGDVGDLLARLDRARPPLRRFLARHARDKEVELFFHWAKTMGPPEWRQSLSRDHLLVLVPAFAISELTEAFAIGFLLFLPFLVVDMVVSNILLAMGMHMLSPVVVSLPFKLLLFIMIDGWSLLAQGLLSGYVQA